jgi:hypothetical protein
MFATYGKPKTDIENIRLKLGGGQAYGLSYNQAAATA